MKDEAVSAQKFDGKTFPCALSSDELLVSLNEFTFRHVTLITQSKYTCESVELTKEHTLQLAQYLTELAENLE